MAASLPGQRSKYLYIGIGIAIGVFVTLWFGSGESPENSAAIDKTTVVEQSPPTIWTCSMHPQIQKTEPGECPICGMDLIPVQNAGGDDSPRRLKMSEAAKKLAEIETSPITRMFAEHESRLIGKVEYDETRTKTITAWFPGRLERLFVDYTGTPVKKGEHLVEIYSPDLLTDQEALLQALKAVKGGPVSSDSNVQKNRHDVLERARERLRLLGLTDEQIQRIETQESPSERIVFYSPIDGIVIQKNAMEGDYVKTGTRVYTIADMTHVWVKMDAYESDLQWIRYGQEVEFTTVAYPGETFRGRVAFIDPFLNEKTRTVKVRVNVKNPDGRLKPDMFVNAVVRSKVTEAGQIMDAALAGKWMCSMHPEIVRDEPGFCDLCEMPLVTSESLGFVDAKQEDQEPPLVVPASAVLITGKRAIVYLEVPNTEKPTFEGREIKVGPRLGEFYVVHEGLTEGENVVTHGNFKIDSALQIQAKPSMMNPMAGGPAMDHAHSGSSKTASPSESVSDHKQHVSASAHELEKVLEHYRQLAADLADDKLEDAKHSAHGIVEAATARGIDDLAKTAANVAEASSLEEVRKNFALISDDLIRALSRHGAPKETLYSVHCPMAFDNRGANWIQWDQDVRNPYFGAAMLKCGSVENEFKPIQNEEGE